ncbi:MAG: hypothetical protein Q9213_001451 [Squamulea squamosa]
MGDKGLLQHPVDSLEPTLALVQLKETGKFFRASQSGNSRYIGLAKTVISQSIPAANLKFHDALDDIETEIIRAKSVFERDLSTIRTKRAERERAAAGILKIRGGSGVCKNAVPKGSPTAVTVNEPASVEKEAIQKSEATTNDAIKEISATEMPSTVVDSEPSPVMVDVTSDTVKVEPFGIPQSLPRDPNEPRGLAISLEQAPPTSAPTTSTKMDPGTIEAPEDLPIQTDAIPPNLSNADFESMFEDSELPGANDEIDFDLAFPSDNANDPAGLVDTSAFGNLPMGNVDTLGDASIEATDEDLTTLLPGLENYVNDSSDFQLHEIPGAKSLGSNNDNSLKSDNNPLATSKVDGVAQELPSFNPPMIESSFEDMFGLDSYMNGTGDDELGGTGNMGEVGDFDEDWFKTDGM